MVEDVRNKKMVVGFLFVEDKILLVRKTHPSWQNGLLNGVGGVVESNERPVEAMVREFHEESGVMVHDWRMFCVEHEPFEAIVYFYVCHAPRGVAYSTPWNSVNDQQEPLSWINKNDLPHMQDKIGNLSWLVPLALDWRSPDPVVVRVTGDIREKASW